MPDTPAAPDPQGPDALRHPAPDTSLAYLAAIVANSDDAIVSKDLNGIIRSWNHAAERIFGYTADEIVGKSILTIIPPDRHGEEAHIIAQLKSGQRIDHFQTVRQRKDGTLVDISVTVSPIKDAAGNIVGASKIARDITESRRLSREREKLYELGKAMAAEYDEQSLVQTITDVATEVCGAQFGAFFYNVIDARGESYTLYTLSGVPREHFSKFPMPRNTHIFSPTFSGSHPVRSDDITKDPRYGQNPPYNGMPKGHLPVRSYLAVPVNSRTGEVLGGLFFGHERTGVFTQRDEDIVCAIAGHASIALDNARLHRKVSETAQNFQQLANSIPQIVWMAKPDGTVFWLNQQWYTFTGTTAPINGHSATNPVMWETLLDPADRDRVVAAWQSALAKGTDWEDTFSMRRKDGTYRWFLSRAIPTRDSDNTITSWFGTNTDVTEQMALAREKEQLLSAERAARSEAERVSRMKDEFLATLSHELRTPLNAILGWSQLIPRSRGNEETLQEGLAVIERNAKVQTQLIEDLLDMSRIVTGKIRLDVQRVDLAAVVDAAVDSVRPTADAKFLRLRKVIDPLAGPISGDPSRLQQVVWNLLTNSIKFTPKGGKIEVLLERVNSHVEVTVTDTGKGISPEFLPHVFERFRQSDSSTTRQVGGLGLGLSIVKHLVELHGGTIRAKSPGEGQGATFTVALPLAVTRHDNDHQREHPTSSSSPTRLDSTLFKLDGIKILVVDDEPDARDLLRRLLEDCKATVLTANSADDAFSLLQAERPDLLISDIGMPGRDGYALIRQIRALPAAEGGNIPAVALTAFARSEDRTRAMLAGYQVHVAKPVEPQELLATAASLIGRTGRDN